MRCKSRTFWCNKQLDFNNALVRIFQGLQRILKIFWESVNFHSSTKPFLYFVFFYRHLYGMLWVIMPMMMQSSLPNDSLQKVISPLQAQAQNSISPVVFNTLSLVSFHLSFNVSIENWMVYQYMYIFCLMIFAYFSAQTGTVNCLFSVLTIRQCFQSIFGLRNVAGLLPADCQ